MAHYRYSQKIGQGGMAEVYLGIQEGLGGFEKPVVVKRIFRHLCQGEHFVKMFLDEARLAATVRHPNVVEIFDIGRDDDGYYIVMEYLSGETVATLAQTLSRQKRKVPPHIACRIGASVAAGLHHAHEAVDTSGNPQPLVHRDVTPSNLIVCYNGAVKIVDFGIAKAIEKADEGSDASAVKGKLSYLAPEQVQHQSLDARTDVFQLGIVLHEMLCGRRLFNARTNHQKILAVLDREIPRPSSYNPAVPQYLDDIVLAALERDRDQRIKSASELRNLLENALKQMGEPVSAAELGNWVASTFPRAHRDRQDLERQAIKFARISPKLLDTSPVEPATVTPVPEAPVLPAAPAPAISNPLFEAEGPTPAANGESIARAHERPDSLISMLLANANRDAGSPVYDPDMEQPTGDVSDSELDSAVAASAHRKRRPWLAVALLTLALAGVAGMLLMRAGGERGATSAKAGYADEGDPRAATGNGQPANGALAVPAATSPAAAEAADTGEATTTYSVSMVVMPKTATVQFDGSEKHVGSFHRTLRRDRSRHVLVVSAPGHETRVISFSATELPPAVVELSAVPGAGKKRTTKKSSRKRKLKRVDKPAGQKTSDGDDSEREPRTDNLDPWATE